MSMDLVNVMPEVDDVWQGVCTIQDFVTRRRVQMWVTEKDRLVTEYEDTIEQQQKRLDNSEYALAMCEKEKADLDNKVAEMSRELEVATLIVDELAAPEKILVSENPLQPKVVELEEELRNVKVELAKITHRCAQDELVSRQVKADLERCEKENEELQAKMTAISGDLKFASDELMKLLDEKEERLNEAQAAQLESDDEDSDYEDEEDEDLDEELDALSDSASDSDSNSDSDSDSGSDDDEDVDDEEEDSGEDSDSFSAEDHEERPQVAFLEVLVENHEAEVSQLESRIAQYRDELAVSETKRKETEKELEDSKKELEHVKEELAVSELGRDLVEKDLENEKEWHKKTEMELVDSISNHMDTDTALKQSKKEIERLNLKLKHQKQDFDSCYGTIKLGHKELSKDYGVLRKEHNELKQVHSELQKEHQELLATSAYQSDLTMQIEQKLADVTGRYQLSEMELAKKSEVCSNLATQKEEQMAWCRTRMLEADHEKRLLDHQLEGANNKISELEEKNRQSSTNNEKLALQYMKLEAELRTVRGENDDLKYDLSSARERGDELRKEVAKLEDQIENMGVEELDTDDEFRDE